MLLLVKSTTLIIYLIWMLIPVILFTKYNKQIGAYYDRVVKELPKPRYGLYISIGIILSIGILLIFFLEKQEILLLLIVLCLILPMLLLIIKNQKYHCLSSAASFFFLFAVSITLVATSDSIRDVFGKKYIKNFHVSYTTEYNPRDETEIEVSHVNTGNEVLDEFLESTFPLLFEVVITILSASTLLLNAYILDQKFFREKETN